MDRMHRRLIVGLVVALVALAGCSDDPDPGAEVPADFTVVEGDGFRFAHPPEWVVIEDTPRRIRVAAQADPGAATATAALTVDDVYTAGSEGFDTALAGLRGTIEAFADDAEVLDEQPVQAPGVAQGTLLESTYRREGTAVHAFDAYLLSEDGVLHYLRASGPADGDVDQLRAVMASVELG